MIVDLAQCPGDLGELVVQEQEYPPLDRVRKNEIIDLGSMCLAVAMDALFPAALHIFKIIDGGQH